MARLRLFASLREVAGTSEVEMEGATVEDVLEGASARFGEAFRAGLATAKVWVNGDPASLMDPVAAADEVALIPPVSGGARRLEGAVGSAAGLQLALLAVSIGVLAVTNALGIAWFAAAVVAVVAVWALDLASEARAGGFELPVGPVLAAVLTGALAAPSLGLQGLGLTAAVAVMASFVWGMGSHRHRAIGTLAPGLVVALAAGVAVGSLLAVRIGTQGTELTGAFLVMAIGSGAAGWAIAHYSRVPLLDPFTGGAVAAVVLGIGAAFLWDLDKLGLLFAAVAVAVGSIAGRTLGSTIRTGRVYLVERAPGALTMVDGPVMAAAVFLPVLRLVL